MINLASLYESMDDYAEAEKLHEEAVEVLLDAAGRSIPVLSEAQRLSWIHKHRPRADVLMSNWRRQGHATGIEAYKVVWRTKALATRLSVTHELGPNASREAQRVFGELRSARLKLASLLSATPNAEKALQVQRAMAKANDSKERLEKKLASLHPATNRRLAVRDAMFEDLLTLLPAGVAVVDFAQLDDWRRFDKQITIKSPGRTADTRTVEDQQPVGVYDAFVVRSDRNNQNARAKWIQLGDAEPIDQVVGQWRRELEGG